MMGVLVDFLKLTARVFGYIVLAVLQWVKKPAGKRVRNEVCLVTGTASSTGIGKLFALAFARQGATLILWDTDREGNENTAKEVRALGATAYTYVCDVSRREAVYSAAELVRKDAGDVTILVNSAGVAAVKPILECPDEQLERTMKTNCHAHFWTVKAFLPHMIGRDHGHIVTVAGSFGLFATGCLEDYCASKFAVVGFHEALSHQLKAKRISGVKTTLVCPYFIDAGMFHGCRISSKVLSWETGNEDSGIVPYGTIHLRERTPGEMDGPSGGWGTLYSTVATYVRARAGNLTFSITARPFCGRSNARYTAQSTHDLCPQSDILCSHFKKVSCLSANDMLTVACAVRSPQDTICVGRRVAAKPPSLGCSSPHSKILGTGHVSSTKSSKV
ncbi:Retinol dehydrogenase 10 [Varanus komodoensis]|nr:Retinol dehydrogenase 10 [Varanus komodoensis]